MEERQKGRTAEHVSSHAAEPIIVSGTTHTIDWILSRSLSRPQHNNRASIQSSWPHWHVGLVPHFSPSQHGSKNKSGGAAPSWLSILHVWVKWDTLQHHTAAGVCSHWRPKAYDDYTVVKNTKYDKLKCELEYEQSGSVFSLGLEEDYIFSFTIIRHTKHAV